MNRARVKGNTQLIAYPRHMADASDTQANIMSVLQSTLEIEKLIELFDNELVAVLPHDNIVYTNTDEQIEFTIGKRAKHELNYRLMLFGQELGNLKITRKSEFHDDEVKKTENLVSALIYPLRNALLYKQAVEKAYLDPLTGVNNRAAFDLRIEQEFALSRRHHNNLCLMMLDIDRFKQINDNHGHLVGDAVLKRFVTCIQDCMRRSDTFFRYGGEEFCILLQNTQISGAKLLAERMRQRIEAENLQIDDISLSITVSIGVTRQALSDSHYKHLLERADHLLYEAKTDGRNRVVAET